MNEMLDFKAKRKEKDEIRKMIEILGKAHSDESSLFSIYIPSNARIENFIAELANKITHIEIDQSDIIRTATRRVLENILGKLQAYEKTPINGIIFFCGIIIKDSKIVEEINHKISPYKPIASNFIHISNHFSTGPLCELLEIDEAIGFIFIGKEIALFCKTEGTKKDILYRLPISFPNFAIGRTGNNIKHRYLMRKQFCNELCIKLSEIATSVFVIGDQVTISSLVVAGKIILKDRIGKNLAPPLRELVVRLINIVSEEEEGLDQAIDCFYLNSS